jgi:sugar phosphate isomerase/epimerase
MMKLGFVTAILPDQTFEEVLQTASVLGYDCVEVMCWPPGKAERRYAGVTHIDASDFSEANARAVTALTEKYGVSISGLGYYPNPLSPDEEESQVAVEHLRRVIEAAALLGVNQVNTFAGRDWTRSVDDNWPQFVDTFTPLVEYASGHNVRFAFENCPMFFTADEWPGGKNLAFSPSLWRRMFEAIPNPNFGLNYDPSHMVWQHMDYLPPLVDFADRIFHVHAKDVRVDRNRLNDVGILATPLEYHSPKLPGLGDVDWGQFFSVLGETGYRGPVCVEVEDRVYEDSLESRRRALQQSHTFLRNFIPKG